MIDLQVTAILAHRADFALWCSSLRSVSYQRDGLPSVVFSETVEVGRFI